MLNKLKELLGHNLIGTGMAEKAAKKLSAREQQLKDAEDEAMGDTPKSKKR